MPDPARALLDEVQAAEGRGLEHEGVDLLEAHGVVRPGVDAEVPRKARRACKRPYRVYVL